MTVLSCFWNSNNYQMLLVLCRVEHHPHHPLLAQPLRREKEQQFVFYSNIAMAKLTAAVSDARVPPLLTGVQGHIRVVLVGDAGQVTSFP